MEMCKDESFLMGINYPGESMRLNQWNEFAVCLLSFPHNKIVSFALGNFLQETHRNSLLHLSVLCGHNVLRGGGKHLMNVLKAILFRIEESITATQNPVVVPSAAFVNIDLIAVDTAIEFYQKQGFVEYMEYKMALKDVSQMEKQKVGPQLILLPQSNELCFDYE